MINSLQQILKRSQTLICALHCIVDIDHISSSIEIVCVYCRLAAVRLIMYNASVMLLGVFKNLVHTKIFH